MTAPPGPLFQALSPTSLAEIEATGAVRGFAAGDRLFLEGRAAAEVLVILEGVVRVWRAARGGASITVRLMRAGDTPGFVAAQRGIPYPANATGIEAGRLMGWPVGAFADLMAREPRLSANAIAMVGARTEEMLTRLHEVSSLGVEQRVARALMRESAAARAAWPDGPEELPLTRQALAELSAATLHTVSRLVSDWRRADIVAASRGRITILDLEALAARAGLRPSLRRNK